MALVALVSVIPGVRWFRRSKSVDDVPGNGGGNRSETPGDNEGLRVEENSGRVEESVVPDSATSTLTRSQAAANIREARNILKDAGVPLRSRNEIIQSFDLETFRIETVASTRTEFRVFDDFSSRLEGRYVSPGFFSSQTDRITNFALPANSATRFGQVTIPEGSVVFTGKVAPQTRFSPGLTGGANQTFLTGPLGNFDFVEVSKP